MKQLLSVFLALTAILTVQAQKLPANSRVIYFGDSQTSFGYSANSVSAQYQNFGHVAWANAMCPAVWTTRGGVLAVAGETTSHMVNRLAPISTFGARMMVVLAGTNDPLYAIDSATTTRNLRRIYDAGIAAGLKVIAITVLPRFAQNVYSPDVERRRKWINSWIKSQADVLVINAEDDLQGPDYFEDGLHLSPLGAYTLGAKVAAAINPLVATCIPGSTNAQLLTIAPNSNPLMAGTNGAKNSVSGSVATGWQLAANFSGGATVVGSKEVDQNGRERQVISISGLYTGTSTTTQRVTFNNYAVAPVNLVSGQVIHGQAEIEIPAAMTNIKNVYLRFQAWTPGFAATIAEGHSMFPTSTKAYNFLPGRYMLRTPPVLLGAGTVGEVTTQLIIEFNSTASSAPVALDLKISSIGLRLLPLAEETAPVLSPSGPIETCADVPVQLTVSPSSGYSYEWRLNGTPIADSVRSTLMVKTAGSYNAIVTSAGCSVSSDAIIVNAVACSPAISLQHTDLPTSHCAGQQLKLPFTTAGSFQVGNHFTAQLSTSDGSFDAPVIIGTLTGTSGGTITATIPASTTAGNGYRVRIVGSQPGAVVSNPSSALAIAEKPQAALSPSGAISISAGTATTLTASPPTDVTYKWLKDQASVPDATGQTYAATEPGAYRVVATTAAGCFDTSAATVINASDCSQLQVSVSSTDASLFTVSAVGGTAPYQYSIDNVQFQLSATFHNLAGGRDYTVYVKDANNCTGQTGFAVLTPGGNEPQQGTQGRPIVYGNQTLGAVSGTAVIIYDMTASPKQMDVFYNGVQVASTGNAVSGKGRLTFPYSPQQGDPSHVTIRIASVTDNTDWWYQALRPVSGAIPAGNGSQTVCQAAYVSPDFPNNPAPNTMLVQTINPATPNTKLRATFRALMLGSGVLSVYDGENTSSPLLGQFTGNYANAAYPSLVATNPQGRLTFHYSANEGSAASGWIADFNCDASMLSQTITFDAVPEKTFGADAFDLTASASSGLLVSFRIVSGPATVNGNLLTLTGAGVVSIEAMQPGNELYSPAALTRELMVLKASQTIDFPAIPAKTTADAPFTIQATATSNLPVSFRVISGPATCNGSVITLTGVGEVVVEATQEGNGNHHPAIAATRSFVVTSAAKQGQTITFPAIDNKTFGDGTFALTANATSGLPVTFRVVSGPASSSGTFLQLTGAGNVVVEAAQVGNASLAAAVPVTQSFTVLKAAQSISFGMLAAKKLGDPAFAISATSSVNLPVSFVVLSGPATISGNMVTLTGSGMVKIEARQNGNENYSAAIPVAQSFTVNSPTRTSQTISFGTLGYKTYTSPAFELTATASSGLPVSYRVVSGAASVSGNVVTITGVGSVNIEASQPGNANFNAATPVQRTFTVGKGSQSIAFNPPTNKSTSDPPFAISANASSGLAVSFRVVSGPARISGNQVTITGSGTITIEASQPGNEKFNAAVLVNRNISVTSGGSTITKQQQFITFNPLSNRSFGEVPFTVSANSSSGLPVSFRVASGPATIWENTVTLTGAGIIAIEAYQDGNSFVQPATPVRHTFQVGKSNQTIQFAGPTSKVSTDPPFALSGRASSGLPVSYRVVSGPATVLGSTVALTGIAGTVVLEATQNGSPNFHAATPLQQSFSVVGPGTTKINQTISFGTLGYKTYTSPAFELTATSSSGFAVQYRAVSGPITVSGNVVTITGVGSAIVEASQPGNANYNPATPVQRSFTVGKGSQSITFVAPPAKTTGDQPFSLTATASSKLSVSYRLVSGPATVSGNTVTLTGGTGTVTIEATQPGNNNYNAAFAVQRSFNVSLGSMPKVNTLAKELLEEPLAELSPADQIIVYPNPVLKAGTIRIVLQETVTGTLVLFDQQGRLVKHFGKRRFEKGTAVELFLEAAALGGGVYFLQLQTPGKMLFKKFQVIQ
jgi:lysophospholipase L1-like esterase